MSGGIRPHKYSKRAAAGLRPSSGGQWGWQQSACFLSCFLTRVLRRSVHKQPKILSGVWMFIAVFTTVHYWILTTASWIQSKPSYFNSLKSLSIWCPIYAYAFRVFSSLQIFRRVRIVAKNACYLSHVCPSFRLSACISSAATWWISVKFDTGNFYENLSRNAKFG